MPSAFKSFAIQKRALIKLKDKQATDWETMFLTNTFNRELEFRIYKQLLQLKNEKINPLKKTKTNVNRHFKFILIHNFT